MRDHTSRTGTQTQAHRPVAGALVLTGLLLVYRWLVFFPAPWVRACARVPLTCLAWRHLRGVRTSCSRCVCTCLHYRSLTTVAGVSGVVCAILHIRVPLKTREQCFLRVPCAPARCSEGVVFKQSQPRRRQRWSSQRAAAAAAATLVSCGLQSVAERRLLLCHTSPVAAQ